MPEVFGFWLCCSPLISAVRRSLLLPVSPLPEHLLSFLLTIVSERGETQAALSLLEGLARRFGRRVGELRLRRGRTRPSEGRR